MTSILVPTMVGDEHAQAIYCASRLVKGYEVLRWFGADFPTRQVASWRFTNEKPVRWSLAGPDLLLDTHSFDVVWLRRPVDPVLPETLHPDDQRMAERENVRFYQSLWYLVGTAATWINPYHAHLRACCKTVQLREAREAGFTIPNTLASNDPEQIVKFIRENEPVKTIYKPFYPARWQTSRDSWAVAETAIVSEDRLPSQAVLQLTPGIFQPLIEKAYEVRATFFGAHAVTLKFSPRRDQETMTDWRSMYHSHLNAEPVDLPPAIYRSCRKLMASLGIIFGCFDFIVTPDREYVFLEVNEMGQFLWKESLVPETKMLEIFLDFLRNPSPNFRWQRSRTGVSFRAVMESDDYHMITKADSVLHIERSLWDPQLLSRFPVDSAPCISADHACG